MAFKFPFTISSKRATTTLESSVTLTDALLKSMLNPEGMTLEKAMSIPAFAGCVNLISGTAKIIPIRLYQYVGEGDEERIEAVEDDRREKLINDDTGDTLDGPNLKGMMVYDYLTSKGGYAYINKPRTKVTSIHYVNPVYVSFEESPDHIFKDYKIGVDGRWYEPHRFIKLLRRSRNGYYGTSIVDENKHMLCAAFNTILLQNTLVKKGGNKRGYLQSEKKLTQESINVLREAFNNMYSGESTPVLNDGVKFQEASSTSVELQLNENRQQDGNDICKIFGVPAKILEGGASDSDWSAFIQYTMMPIMEDFCQVLNRDLLLEKEKGKYFWQADVSELTKGDILKRFEAYKTAISAGFLQIDEVRKKESLPGLDLPFVKLGLQDVLLDPSTGGVYTPNTGMWGSLNDQTKDGPPADGVPPNEEEDLEVVPEPDEPIPKGETP